jgi:hypothetical protein
MFLELTKRQTLLAVLEQLFREPGALQTFLRDKCGHDLYQFGPAGGTMVDFRSAVVADAVDHEWLDMLLQALIEVAPPQARKLLDTVGTIEEIREGRFFDACEHDRYPLVNRSGLRTSLREVAKDDGPRILLVRGERRSGKSHTLYHLRHVAAKLGIPLAEIPLRDYAELPIDPKVLGGIIAARLEWKIPDHLDEKRWTLSFLNELEPLIAPPKQRRIWIAIDDFEPEYLKHVPLDPAVRSFIVHLAARIGGAASNARLFLINYDEEVNLPDSARPRMIDDSTRRITDEDLVRFFASYRRERLPLADPVEAANDAAIRAKRVKKAMRAATGNERLKAMRNEVRKQCDEIDKQRGLQ